MKTYSVLQIGEFHTNHCEDYLVDEEVGTNRRLIAVLDGCTMGKESVFASMLYGKILRKIAKNHYFKEPYSSILELKSILKEIMKSLFEEVNHIKNRLDLDQYELLSTLVLGIYDFKDRNAEIIAIGDGVICWDGEWVEFEQDNQPDYLGYHLTENFETWYERQKQTISIKNFTDLSISTDGILSFKDLMNNYDINEEEIINHFLLDKDLSEHNNFLKRKLQLLEKEKNYTLTDDLAILRVILD